MKTIYKHMHEAFHGAGTLNRRLETVVYILIALSILLLLPEIVLGADHVLVENLAPIDQALLWFFGIEVSLRILSYRPPALDFYSPKVIKGLKFHLVGRLRFCLSPLVLIDLITVLALVPALRGFRAIRLLRLLRGARLFRYSSPFMGLARALSENRLLYAFGISLVGTATIVGGVTIYLVERGTNPTLQNIGDGLWWALVTLTTVGFGDIAPVSGLGRIVGGLLMVSGMVAIGLFTGIVTQTLPRAILSIREEQIRMSAYLNHLVVCGYEPGAEMFLDSLRAELDPEQTPIIFFAPGERPATLPPEFIWVSGDPTKESELDKLRLQWARGTVLVGRRSLSPQQADAVTILTAFTMRAYLKKNELAEDRKKPFNIVAEVLDAENFEHIRTAGADEVIESTKMGFSLLAHALSMPGTAHVMGTFAGSGDNSLYVGLRPVESTGTTTFAEVSTMVKNTTGALVLGIRDPKTGEDQINPADELEICEDTQLLYLASEPVLPSI